MLLIKVATNVIAFEGSTQVKYEFSILSYEQFTS